MGRVVVIEFTTLDGVVEDPDGSGGWEHGGWLLRYGLEPVSNDPFRISEILESGTLLVGRVTWQLFSVVWPSRTDEFAQKWNNARKLVASRTLQDVDAWGHSTLLKGDLVEEVSKLKHDQDVLVSGSSSVVDTLMRHDLIDEYRLVVFPMVIGQGRRLFEHGPIHL